MPIEVTDLDNGRGNLISGKGIVTEEEYVSTLTAHLTQDRNKFKKYLYSHSDFTDVTQANISNKAIAQIVELCKMASEVNQTVIVSFVASTDHIYGLSRMTQAMMACTGWEHEVFRNKENAVVWLKQRVKDKHGITDINI